MATLEESVEFYTGLEFTDSPAGEILGPIVLTDTEVLEIAAFLRALNALENIRASIDGLESARELNNFREVTSMLGLIHAEIEDAIHVLSEALVDGINPDAVELLAEAAQLVEEAAEEPVRGLRQSLIDDALEAVEAARADIAMVVA